MRTANVPLAYMRQQQMKGIFMNYDSLIFDIDGTLWDSTETIAHSYNKAIFETTGIEAGLTADDLKRLFGKTMDDIAAELFPQYLGGCFEQDPERYRALARLCYIHQDEDLFTDPPFIYPLVRETMEKLEAEKKLFIVSNCQSGYIEQFMDISGTRAFISDWLCFGDTGLPKSETIKQLMSKNGLHKENTVYVGDLEGDADSAHAAGIAFIWASYGFGNVPEAKREGMISSFAVLLSTFRFASSQCAQAGRSPEA